MEVAGHHLLAGAGFAGNQDARLAARHLIGEVNHIGHRIVLEQQCVAFLGDGLEHGGNQFRLGGKRQVFLGTGPDRRARRLGIRPDAAGDDGDAEALGRQTLDEAPDVLSDFHQYQVGAAPGAELAQRDFRGIRVGNLGAPAHGDLGRRDDLASQRTDDQ